MPQYYKCILNETNPDHIKAHDKIETAILSNHCSECDCLARELIIPDAYINILGAHCEGNYEDAQNGQPTCSHEMARDRWPHVAKFVLDLAKEAWLAEQRKNIEENDKAIRDIADQAFAAVNNGVEDPFEDEPFEDDDDDVKYTGTWPTKINSAFFEAPEGWTMQSVMINEDGTVVVAYSK